MKTLAMTNGYEYTKENQRITCLAPKFQLLFQI